MTYDIRGERPFIFSMKTAAGLAGGSRWKLHQLLAGFALFKTSVAGTHDADRTISFDGGARARHRVSNLSRCRRYRTRRSGRSHAAGAAVHTHRVQRAGLGSRLLGMCRADGAEVVSSLQTAQP